MPLAFDPDPDEFARWAATAAKLIAERLRSPGEGPVFRPAPPELSESVESSVWPEAPQPPSPLLDEFERLIWPYPMGNNHPRFFGWVNTPSAPIAIIGEMLAAAMNPSVAGGGHAATYVEHHVLKWFRDLFSFPSESAGLLVSGGSMATLTALTVARHVKAGWDVRAEGLQAPGQAPLVLYMSDQGHTCITKSAELLGLGRKFVRVIEADAECRMDIERLATHIKADRAAGLHPFCVVASAGTVGTGAIDPLDAIAELCAHAGLWFHVDGAIGAVAILLDEFRDALRGLERADSIAFDPHKWLYVPVECGAVVVRDGGAMRDAFSLVPAYLRTQRDPTGGLPWFSEFGFQQSRGFRALKLWMALRYYGRSGYRAMLRHCIAMAELLRDKIMQRADLEPLAWAAGIPPATRSSHADARPPSDAGATIPSDAGARIPSRTPPGANAFPRQPARLPIVTFRYRSPGSSLTDEQFDRLNEAIMHQVQQRGRAFLTQARLGPRFALRASVLNYRTIPADIDALIEEVCEIGGLLASQI